MNPESPGSPSDASPAIEKKPTNQGIVRASPPKIPISRVCAWS
jgi:hypothetical protein